MICTDDNDKQGNYKCIYVYLDKSLILKVFIYTLDTDKLCSGDCRKDSTTILRHGSFYLRLGAVGVYIKFIALSF